MSSPTISSKKRLVFILLAISVLTFGLIIRLGYVQLLWGQFLKEQAIEQWAKNIPIKPIRGIIYDRNGNPLSINISAFTVDCVPADVVNPKKTASVLAKILSIDENELYDKITKNQSIVKIKQWIEEDEVVKVREAALEGIIVVPSNKRYYPFGNFASYILGFTDIDNRGLYGLERTYDKYLSGTPGRLIQNTDSLGRQLPEDVERIVDPQPGLSAILTIDETIQHIAEKAALEALVKNKAKRAAVLVMQPKTGDILAMATKPDYDPNEPRVPLEEGLKEIWDSLPEQQLVQEWNDIWRPYTISDIYEPGSTFKIVTAAAGLEEKVVTPDSRFYCDGFVRQVKSPKPIKCWRYYNPHGSQTFVEGVQNSCNEVFIEVGLRLGQEKMYEYIKAFGFGYKTGIELSGEETGIVTRPEYMREVNLATISFGQGIAVTPIQLVTAASAIANGGNLMEPRLVKSLIDRDGNVINDFKTKVKGNPISQETSETLLQILESVVSEGTGSKAYYPGYRIGGKTGTAQKVIDGRYAAGKYVASFLAIAPTDNPEVVVLVIIDEPSTGIYYGGQIAAPVAGEVTKEILDYLEIELKYTEKELEQANKSKVTVPDLRDKSLKEAAKILSSLGFKYSTEILDVEADAKVIDQFPMPNTNVTKGSNIELYVQTKRNESETVVVPNLTGKSAEEAVDALNQLNLRFKFDGSGIVTNQEPKAGTEVDFNSLIEVEFIEKYW